MASLDPAIGYHRLDTEFFSDHVRHTTFHSDAARGMRRVEVVKDWYREREIGRGSFGTVFLEKSENGEYRAVKDIAKKRNSRIIIDYRRELKAMATLAKHDALFVQLRGWYESNHYVHIAMEYISHGDLREYLEVMRPESEAKAITRQLLEGLLVIHQEGFAHRDLKPENIFIVSTSPVWVKIGDFGLAKLARDGTAFRTEGGTRDYIAPEAGIDTSRETSEYTNAVDIWALGCITHEILTQTLPLRGLRELSSYCSCPKLPRDTMLGKNISKSAIEFVERALAYPPERRITAKEALDLGWLRLGDKAVARQETEEGRGAAEAALSAAALGRKMDMLSFIPAVDDNERELQKLLGEDEGLGEEVALGLIRNLKIPSPSSQTPLAEKDILFPAYLINIITSEMWDNGFVKESERFLANVMQSIQNEVMSSKGDGDGAINHGAFWLSNVHEMLSFAFFAEDWYETQKKDGYVRDNLLQIVKHDLESLEFNIYHTWMKALKRKLQRMIVSAVIESQSLPRFITQDDVASLFRDISGQQFSMDDILSLLNKVYNALQGYFIEESTVVQAVTELLRLVGVTAFNNLLLQLDFSSWKRGVQVNHNVQLIAEWCKSHDMPKGIFQLEHLLQATKLLQMEKATLNDVEILQDRCWLLTPNQIQKLLRQYRVSDSEQPINEELMRAIASRVTTKDATLFLQAVDLDNTGYDVAEPRTITALVAYIPSYLQTNRLRRIADIVSTRTQERAGAKRLAAGGVKSEGSMNSAPLPAELEPVHE